MLALAFSVVAAASAAPLPAVAAAAAPKGYVVKIEGPKVWIDLTAADGAQPGRPFTVFQEGEELKHPVTGASLGRVEKTLGTGAIREVAEKFSVGDVNTSAGMIASGNRVRLGAAPAPAPAAAPAPAVSVRPGETELRAPRSRGAALPFSVVSMAAGDFDGAGRPQLALADEKGFRLYAYPAAEHKPIAQAEIAGTGARIVSLESGDLDGDKKDELFVSVYNEGFKRFETWAYRLEGGNWAKSGEMPWLVRAIQGPDGKRVVATQQIQDDKTFPFGGIYPLVWQDGKYVQGRPGLKPKRVDWLYAFTWARVDAEEPALVYLTSVNALRFQFKKGQWRSKESYGQSPIRVRWHDDLLEFHPPMVPGAAGDGPQTLYAVRNIAMLGGLANPFGLFNNGELHALAWNGVAAEKKWKAELGGASEGFALVEPEAGRRELVIAVTGSAGKSAVWTFDP